MTEDLMGYKHLTSEQDRHGNPRLYYRKGHGQRIRMWIMPGHADFKKAYEAAEQGREWIPDVGAKELPRQVTGGSMRALVASYYLSDDFVGLDGETTQKKRRSILDGCMDEPINEGGSDLMGECPIEHFDEEHVKRLQKLKAGTPEAANGRVKALRRLFAWACSTNPKKAYSNPTTGAKTTKSVTGGHHTWTVEEVYQFWEKHPIGSKPRLLCDIFLFTGLRISDASRFGRPHVSKEWASINQWKGRKKTRKMIEFPILPILRASIDAYPSKGLTFIQTVHGKPHTTKGLGNYFRDCCDEAGLFHCSAHGLRKAGATIAAENGASESILMSIFGWDDPKMAALYTKAARRRKMAKQSMHLLIPITEEADDQDSAQEK